MSIKFISLNAEWIKYMKEYFTGIPSIITECTDITTISPDNTCFVSPANSIGFMDGGIDLVLSRTIMPGIESKVKRRIRELGILTTIGRPYLPIGSVITVHHDDTTHLIVAPTMFLPHDVSGTQNAYWSFFAALKMWKKLCDKADIRYNLVVTSHCCGYGKMSENESARQMKKAYDDFISNSGPVAVTEFDDCIIFPNRDMEQPRNYDNREIKELQMSCTEFTKMLLSNISL
jgi:O-acetyl-ADP-ribose deacetylase (regulator of RNase III)